MQPVGDVDRSLAVPGVTQRGDEAGEPSGADAGDVLPVDGDLPGQGGAQRLGAGELAQAGARGRAARCPGRSAPTGREAAPRRRGGDRRPPPPPRAGRRPGSAASSGRRRRRARTRRPRFVTARSCPRRTRRTSSPGHSTVMPCAASSSPAGPSSSTASSPSSVPSRRIRSSGGQLAGRAAQHPVFGVPQARCVQLGAQRRPVVRGRLDPHGHGCRGCRVGRLGAAIGPFRGVAVEHAGAARVRYVADHEPCARRPQQRVGDRVQEPRKAGYVTPVSAASRQQSRPSSSSAGYTRRAAIASRADRAAEAQVRADAWQRHGVRRVPGRPARAVPPATAPPSPPAAREARRRRDG